MSEAFLVDVSICYTEPFSTMLSYSSWYMLVGVGVGGLDVYMCNVICTFQSRRPETTNFLSSSTVLNLTVPTDRCKQIVLFQIRQLVQV